VSESIIVGLDGRDRSLAALRWAARLRRLDTDPDRIDVIGVHAYVEADLQAIADTVRLEKAIAQRRREVWGRLVQAEVEDELAQMHVERGPSVRDVLHRLCRTYTPLALVIGKRAKAEGRNLPPRLGSAARRLVRHPPAPLGVVPPNYDPYRRGTGDVVVLSDLTDETVPAVRYAAALAGRFGRALRPLHVVPGGYVRHASSGSLAVDRSILERTAVETDTWIAALGVAAGAARVAAGDVVEQTLECVETLDPLALVVGTRELSLGERALVSSHSSELAAKAPCPVVVVPPPD
jgi:nucleotide-binding universal stress UspA family protein